MNFLAPWFLGGLALLAVPIVVHLINRERQTPLKFPSLMFVRRVPHRAIRRRRLRNLPLFLMRCLALLLLAAAFARPFLDRNDANPNAAGVGGREVVVLLDRSYSMSAGDRWTRAVAAARRVVDGITPADRATIVYFDAAPAAATSATENRAALRMAVDTARVGSGVTRYAPAIAFASRLLQRSSLPKQEVVLVTDFQRAGWSGDARLAEARLPVGATLTPIDVGGDTTGNVAVTHVELKRDVVDGRERVAATARLVNAGSSAERAVSASLELNGRQVQAQPVRVPANGSAVAAFEPVAVPDGWTRATVRVDADAQPADDAFHFALSRGQVVRVLLVEGAAARGDASLYVRRALDVGDRPPFRVDVARAAALRAADLAGRSLVILNDAPVDAAALALLDAYVRAGGGLLVATGDASASRAWSGRASSLLAAMPGDVVDRSAQGGARLASMERGHPVFEPFATPRSGDLSAPRVLRYRELDPADGASVLARFDDGAPALVERAVGTGRVLVWASTFDVFWNDLALQPVFVPLVQQLATHTARYAESRPWLTAGELLDLSRAARGDSARWAVTTPAGRNVRIGGAGVPPAMSLTEQGFYQVRPVSAPDARPTVVAVNLDPTEADPARIEPAELAAAVTNVNGTATRAGAEPLTANEREARQSVWWYLLVAALLLLLAETVLSNRTARVAART